mmetsp:Transcript_6411/g.15434  ORF Transcript_6411/g.15434 Transcript_6411/m.15434 type:complete len:88 (+) Transcript_6411:1231-1494(+)
MTSQAGTSGEGWSLGKDGSGTPAAIVRNPPHGPLDSRSAGASSPAVFLRRQPAALSEGSPPSPSPRGGGCPCGWARCATREGNFAPI